MERFISPLRILVLREIIEAAVGTVEQLRRLGYNAAVARDLEHALHEIETGAASAAILDWPYGKRILDFLSANSRFERFPRVALLHGPPQDEDVFEVYRHGADVAFTQPVADEIWIKFLSAI